MMNGQPQHTGLRTHSSTAGGTVTSNPMNTAPRADTFPPRSNWATLRPTTSATATQPSTMPAASASGTGSSSSIDTRISSRPTGMRITVLISAAATRINRIMSTMASDSSAAASRKVSSPSPRLCAGSWVRHSATRRVGRGQMSTISRPSPIKSRPIRPALTSRPTKLPTCCPTVRCCGGDTRGGICNCSRTSGRTGRSRSKGSSGRRTSGSSSPRMRAPACRSRSPESTIRSPSTTAELRNWALPNIHDASPPTRPAISPSPAMPNRSPSTRPPSERVSLPLMTARSPSMRPSTRASPLVIKTSPSTTLSAGTVRSPSKMPRSPSNRSPGSRTTSSSTKIRPPSTLTMGRSPSVPRPAAAWAGHRANKSTTPNHNQTCFFTFSSYTIFSPIAGLPPAAHP